MLSSQFIRINAINPQAMYIVLSLNNSNKMFFLCSGTVFWWALVLHSKLQKPEEKKNHNFTTIVAILCVCCICGNLHDYNDNSVGCRPLSLDICNEPKQYPLSVIRISFFFLHKNLQIRADQPNGMRAQHIHWQYDFVISFQLLRAIIVADNGFTSNNRQEYEFQFFEWNYLAKLILLLCM